MDNINKRINRMNSLQEDLSDSRYDGFGSDTEDEFDSMGTEVLREIVGVMDDVENELLTGWPKGRDPDLEGSILEVVEGILFDNSFQLADSLDGWSQELFDRVGGRGTLRELWRRLKQLKQVIGLKRKLSSSLSSVIDEDIMTEADNLISVDLTAGAPSIEEWCAQATDMLQRLGIQDEVEQISDTETERSEDEDRDLEVSRVVEVDRDMGDFGRVGERWRVGGGVERMGDRYPINGGRSIFYEMDDSDGYETPPP